MDKLIILGHENPDVDSIISGYLLEKILKTKGYNAEFVIPDEKIEEETLDICIRNGLNPAKYQKKIDNNSNVKYILVDHNERELPGEVIAIIDHHPTSKDIKIKEYYNDKISSTACFICQHNEDILNKFDLSLAVLATLIDTVSFHSTKSRVEDENWVIDLCNKYNINYEELYKEGLGVTKLDNLNKASLNGLKKHNFESKNFQSSYIQVENPIKEEKNINKIINILKEYIEINQLDAFVFIVHDMTKFQTTYYLITKGDIKTNSYDKYTPRGNTIIPEVEKTLKGEKI